MLENQTTDKIKIKKRRSKKDVRSLVDVDASNLDGAEYAAHDEGGRHEILLVSAREVGAGGAREEDGRGDDAREHGQGVLESEEHGQDEGHLVVEAEEGAGRRLASLATEEGDVGPEEGCVVVAADEAIAGRQGMDEALVKRLLGGSPREDGIVVHCVVCLSRERGS